MYIIAHIEKPRMIQAHIEIPVELLTLLEDYFCELDDCPWMLKDDRILQRYELYGYFDETGRARNAYSKLREAFPQLPKHAELVTLEDRDWKEAYKEHFKPWSANDLHWVPAWEKDRYEVPQGHHALYLDPGMAFGTGNHETTRLCALRLVDVAKEWSGDLSKRTVIDAGTGSGILSISAAALGFRGIRAFDIDPDSVEIAIENAMKNGLQHHVDFFQGDLNKGLQGTEQADLVLANILANVLTAHSELLLNSVKPGGMLVLSGILGKEIADVRKHFEEAAAKSWGAYTADSRDDGEWSDLCLRRS